ncbi:MAG: OmpH family outer membrane protein [Chromatiales bacterium]|nr:OmpH family outer membrane protein [Chromatiales bacterium]
MRRRLGLVFGIFAILVSGMGTVAQAQDLKIGFVDAARVIKESPQMDAARRSIEKEFSPRDRELKSMEESIKRDVASLKRDGAVLSESKRRDMERDIRQKERELERSRDEAREDLSIRQNEALANLTRQAEEAVAGIAKQQKYDLILNNAGVAFASKRVDITDEVLARLRADFNKSGK